jgi:hypothetical protein
MNNGQRATKQSVARCCTGGSIVGLHSGPTTWAFDDEFVIDFLSFLDSHWQRLLALVPMREV